MNSSSVGSKEAEASLLVVYTLCYVSGRCCVNSLPSVLVTAPSPGTTEIPCCTASFTLQSKQHWDHTKATAQKGIHRQRLPEQGGCGKAQNESEGTNCNDKSERMLEMGEGQRKVCCLVENDKKKEVTSRLTHSVVFSHDQGAGTQKLSMLPFNRCVEKSKIEDRKPFRHLRNVDTLK